jgi:hypothetical protein
MRKNVRMPNDPLAGRGTNEIMGFKDHAGTRLLNAKIMVSLANWTGHIFIQQQHADLLSRATIAVSPRCPAVKTGGLPGSGVGESSYIGLHKTQFLPRSNDQAAIKPVKSSNP